MHSQWFPTCKFKTSKQASAGIGHQGLQVEFLIDNSKSWIQTYMTVLLNTTDTHQEEKQENYTLHMNQCPHYYLVFAVMKV